MKRELPLYCDICLEPIPLESARFEFPDGLTVCTSPDCTEEWMRNYHVLGSR